MHQVHGIDDKRYVGCVFTLGIITLLVLEDGERFNRIIPPGQASA